jgi:hypothetical protein
MLTGGRGTSISAAIPLFCQEPFNRNADFFSTTETVVFSLILFLHYLFLKKSATGSSL